MMSATRANWVVIFPWSSAIREACSTTAARAEGSRWRRPSFVTREHMKLVYSSMFSGVRSISVSKSALTLNSSLKSGSRL